MDGKRSLRTSTVRGHSANSSVVWFDIKLQMASNRKVDEGIRLLVQGEGGYCEDQDLGMPRLAHGGHFNFTGK